jgi:hypothetical protein
MKFIEPIYWAVRRPWESDNKVIGKIQLLLLVYAFGWLVAAVYYYCNGVYFQRGYPYNTFLCLPNARFLDYDDMVIMCQNLDPYHDLTRSGYPPFANFVYYLFSTFSMRFGFFVFVLAPIVFLRWAVRNLAGNISTLGQLLLLIFPVLFSYPFLFAFDRGNLELYIMIGLGVFLIFYNADEFLFRDLSILGLSVAICLKVYPILFVLILFKDRRYMDLFKVTVLCVAITIASGAMFAGGSFAAIHDFIHMVGTTDKLVKEQIEYAHANSGMFYAFVIFFRFLGMAHALAIFERFYWAIALGVLAVYGVVIATSRMSFWACATSLVCLMCLTPSLSNDYRTLQLIVPMLMFILTMTPKGRAYTAITVFFGILLVPRNYIILFPNVGSGDVGIAGIITPLLLFMILNVVIVAERARWRVATPAIPLLRPNVAGLPDAAYAR